MPPPRGLVQQLDQQLHRSGLLPRGGRLLVAVSGGADSVALLLLMVSLNGSDYWRWKLVIGHVDHGMRGRASRADAAFVAKLGKKMEIPLASTRLKLNAGTSEDAARQARLRALKSMARARRCGAVVMAHHADDQAETVLMRIFRGCGIDGLGGIRARSQVDGLVILRPLLHIRRQELQEFLTSSGQDWKEDASNASPDYLRNRLRQELMPVAETLWPQAVGSLGRLARIAAEAQEAIASEAAALLAGARSKSGSVAISRQSLRSAPGAVAAEALRQLVERVGGSVEMADFERISEALRLVRGSAGGKRIELGKQVVLQANGDRITISRHKTR